MSKKINEPYTEIANRLIRSRKLDVFEKMVFIAISSCNPSFPSYEALMNWLGISNDKLWKSLKTLEGMGLILRFKKGRSVEYCTAWNSPPNGEIGAIRFKPLRPTENTSPPDGDESLRQTETKKNKEKEQIKISKMSFSNSEEKTVAEVIQMAIERTAV